MRDAQQQAGAFFALRVRATEPYRMDGDASRLVVAQLSVGDATFWVQHDSETKAGAGGARRIRLILSMAGPDNFFARSVAGGRNSGS